MNVDDMFVCCCFCKFGDVGTDLDGSVHCILQDCDVSYDDVCGHYVNYCDSDTD